MILKTGLNWLVQLTKKLGARLKPVKTKNQTLFGPLTIPMFKTFSETQPSIDMFLTILL